MIAAGANGKIISGQAGFIINWIPVIRDIIQIHNSLGLVWDGKIWNPHGFPHGLGSDLVCKTGIVIVRVNIFQWITIRFFTADEKMVAGFRPGIDTKITIRGYNT